MKFWVGFIIPFRSYFLTPLGLLCVVCDVSVFAFLRLSSVRVIGPGYCIGPMRFDPVLACSTSQFAGMPENPVSLFSAIFNGYSAAGLAMVFSFSDLSKYARSISLYRI